jgi:signal transduction histidine kinase
MAAVAARVDAGDLHPRIGDRGEHGQAEVRVLAEAFDHMLDRLTEAFDAQRAFVADASHELRTPLTVIRGQIEVLAAKGDPSAEDVRSTERAVSAEIARVTRLVDDLLLLARSEHRQFLRYEPIELDRFVRELWDGATALDERRFALGALPAGWLRADPDRLAQALRNLIGNAIQHTEPGSGVVAMSVRAAAHGSVRFVVEDDGPGIPADEREHIFDRFKRLGQARDRASGGTGLGLAIVRAIALAHDGRAWAEESPLGGACLVLELPRFSLAPAPAPAPASAQDAGVSDRVAAGLGPNA